MSELREIVFLIAGAFSLHHCAGKLIYSLPPSDSIWPALGQELPDLDFSDFTSSSGGGTCSGRLGAAGLAVTKSLRSTIAS